MAVPMGVKCISAFRSSNMLCNRSNCFGLSAKMYSSNPFSSQPFRSLIKRSNCRLNEGCSRVLNSIMECVDVVLLPALAGEVFDETSLVCSASLLPSSNDKESVAEFRSGLASIKAFLPKVMMCRLTNCCSSASDEVKSSGRASFKILVSSSSTSSCFLSPCCCKCKNNSRSDCCMSMRS